MSIDVKQNKVLVIGGGTLALLIAIAGFFLWKFSSAHSDARQLAEGAKTQIEDLNKKAITPTPDNVRILNSNITYLNQWKSNYVGRLFSALPPTPALGPSQFQVKAKKELATLEATAAERGITLGATDPKGALMQPGQPEEDAERFFFAFERYTEEGKKPLQTEIPRLQLQLAVVQDLVNILFDITVEHPVPGSSNEVESVHIDAVLSVQREVFEKIDDDVGNRGLPPRVMFEQSADDAVPDAPLYDREEIAIGFSGEEQHLWLFLNEVNKLPYPAIVSRLRMKNANPNLQPFDKSQQAARRQVAPGPIPGMLPGGLIEGMEGFDEAMAAQAGQGKLNFVAGEEGVLAQVVISIAKPHVPTEEEGLNP